MFHKSIMYSNKPSEYNVLSSSNISAAIYIIIASSMGPGNEPRSCFRQSSNMVSIHGNASNSKVICTTRNEAAPKSTGNGKK